MPARQSQDSEPVWHKSSASGSQNQCVEIACEAPAVLVRDSRDPSGAVLAFPSGQWSAFVRRIRDDNGISARR